MKKKLVRNAVLITRYAYENPPSQWRVLGLPGWSLVKFRAAASQQSETTRRAVYYLIVSYVLRNSLLFSIIFSSLENCPLLFATRCQRHGIRETVASAAEEPNKFADIIIRCTGR